ncbi:MAG: glycosyltransferase family 4 protein [Proteobacteria bacterium]|nr:glycosyltransferase family 4 protein [Pseudomonadota bacterium]
MKVLIATRVFPPDVRSGVATVMGELWSRIRQDYDARLVAGFWTDESLLPADAKAVRMDPDHMLKSRGAMELAVRRAALTFRPDVILAHGIEIPVDLAPTVGLLTDPRAGERLWGRVRGVRKKLYLRRIAKMAVPIVPTEAARQRWAGFGAAPDRLRVASPGVDTAAFRPQERVSTDGPLRLLYAARIEPGKGQHVAIEAVKGLHPNVRDRVHLDLVGPVADTTYMDGLKRRAVDAPVSFHGDVSDLALRYRQADIVLFPTVMEEVFGYSAVDGMACGKPVVFSKIGAVREVTAGVGVEVPPGDVKRFGEAIRRLVKNPDECRELGRRGRELVVERYSWAAAWSRYRALLEEAAGR